MKNYIFILATLLYSCTKPLNITVVTNITSGPNTIIFDDKDTLIANKPASSIFLSPYKEHSYSINNSKPQNFRLFDREGILNIARKEFVILQTRYESVNEEGVALDMYEFTMTSYMLIDSFLVCHKGSEITDKAKLKTLVDSIKVSKNGNYKDPIAERFRALEDYDNSEEVNNFKKIGNKDLFIPKFWDYNLGDTIPEEIKVRESKERLKYKRNVKKNFIIFADDFLAFAKLSKDYSVVNVRDLLRAKIDNRKKPLIN